MNRVYVLLLAGLFGYIAHPFLPPKLIGVAEKKDAGSSDPLPEKEVKVEKPIAIPEKPVVIPEKPSLKKLGSHKMAKRDDLPEIVVEPKKEPEVDVKVKELSETDFKIIITNGVEAGGRIDFRKDNIISWKLKEQVFSLQGSQYEGEISIEVGTLFGPELRRAKLVIKDEVISSWQWLVDDKKE